ncbi:MAG TPA: hypothetical protein ENK58_10010 [Desulfobacterales bacterium]|nr:MAG: hypothetical protein DRI57_20960 [Deltaproteobacteria bacterium]HHC25722.1 hypothetical protein [Desulfobacterales bacterium]
MKNIRIKSQIDKYAPFSEKLKAIYAAMDEKYKTAADYYDFHCTGCKDNCCLTRFYHHTFLEYFCIIEGYDTLRTEQQAEVKKRAAEVCRKAANADEKGLAVQLMCPLNIEGLCLLYAYRPMICRLHGIPHELRKPGQNAVHHPGCEAFTGQCEKKGCFKFDRTPFYIEMASLERDMKQVLGTVQKLKMTIAQMLA